jgi:hypothetical protein
LCGVRGGEGAVWKTSCCRVWKVEEVGAGRIVDEEAAVCDGIASFRGVYCWRRGSNRFNWYPIGMHKPLPLECMAGDN